jgi:hypothetical protein
MQFRQLRQILQHIVLAGMPLAASACGLVDDDQPCVETRSRILYATEPAEASLQLKIDNCRVDVDACTALCTAMMRSAEILEAPNSCEVKFLDDDRVQASVIYVHENGGSHCPVEGRRPSGLAAPVHAYAQTAAGAWLAHAAWLEAASVHAFLHLADELERHHAPRALVRLALAAAKDEVRHTTMMTHLAKRYGAEPPPANVVLPGPRPLEAIAIENAAEGCVRETWGAVIAQWQAHASPDREVRDVFRAIAKDEARHAALAWAVHEWIMPLLDDAARARVLAAREAAAHELFEIGDGTALAVIGLPTGEQTRGLLARTNHALWGGLS